MKLSQWLICMAHSNPAITRYGSSTPTIFHFKNLSFPRSGPILIRIRTAETENGI